MQTIIVIVWITLNVVAVRLRWDPYPFILLNLAFSTQAAYAAPLILLAQNRQADRDRVQSEEDRARAASTRADTEYLARELASLRVAVGELATRDFIRGELHRLLVEGRGRREAREEVEEEARRRRAGTGRPRRLGTATTGCCAPPRLDLEPLRVDHAAEAVQAFDDDRLHTFTGGRPATEDELRDRYTRQAAGGPPTAARRGSTGCSGAATPESWSAPSRRR